MNLPRRLYKTVAGPVTKAEDIVEEDDPRAAWNWLPKGFPMADVEAERIGLKAYLDRTGWGEKAKPPEAAEVEAPAPQMKAVDQAETEDKAMRGPKEAKAEEPKSAEAKPSGDREARQADPGVGQADAEQASDSEKSEDPGPGLHLDPGLRRGRR